MSAPDGVENQCQSGIAKEYRKQIRRNVLDLQRGINPLPWDPGATAESDCYDQGSCTAAPMQRKPWGARLRGADPRLTRPGEVYSPAGGAPEGGASHFENATSREQPRAGDARAPDSCLRRLF